jgi:hypothetical protein
MKKIQKSRSKLVEKVKQLDPKKKDLDFFSSFVFFILPPCLPVHVRVHVLQEKSSSFPEKMRFLSPKKRFFSEKKEASIVLLFRFCFFFASFHTNSNFVYGKFCLAPER